MLAFTSPPSAPKPPLSPLPSVTAPAAVERVRVHERAGTKRTCACALLGCTYIKGVLGVGLGFGKQSERASELGCRGQARVERRATVSSPFAFRDVIVRGRCGWHGTTPLPAEGEPPHHAIPRQRQRRTRTDLSDISLLLLSNPNPVIASSRVNRLIIFTFSLQPIYMWLYFIINKRVWLRFFSFQSGKVGLKNY